MCAQPRAEFLQHKGIITSTGQLSQATEMEQDDSRCQIEMGYGHSELDEDWAALGREKQDLLSVSLSVCLPGVCLSICPPEVYLSISMRVSDIYASEDCLYVFWGLPVCPLETVHLSPWRLSVCSPGFCPLSPWAWSP